MSDYSNRLDINAPANAPTVTTSSTDPNNALILLPVRSTVDCTTWRRVYLFNRWNKLPKLSDISGVGAVVITINP
jgi:hypothetical protein